MNQSGHITSRLRFAALEISKASGCSAKRREGGGVWLAFARVNVLGDKRWGVAPAEAVLAGVFVGFLLLC